MTLSKKSCRELSAALMATSGRTAIAPVENEIDIEDLIEEEDVRLHAARALWLHQARQPTSVYRSQQPRRARRDRR